MDPNEARELLVELAAGELDEALEAAVRAAVDTDTDLQRVLAQYRAMDVLLKRFARATRPIKPADAVEAALADRTPGASGVRNGRRGARGRAGSADPDRSGRRRRRSQEAEPPAPAWKAPAIRFGIPAAIVLVLIIAIMGAFSGGGDGRGGGKEPHPIAIAARQVRSPAEARVLAVLLELERDRVLVAEPRLYARSVVRAAYAARLARSAVRESDLEDLAAYIKANFRAPPEDQETPHPPPAWDVSPETSESRRQAWIGERLFEARQYTLAIEQLEKATGETSARLLGAVARLRAGDPEGAGAAVSSIQGGLAGQAARQIRQWAKQARQAADAPAGATDASGPAACRRYIRLGRYEKALEAVAAEEARLSTNNYLRGICLKELGRIEEALAVFDRGTSSVSRGLTTACFFEKGECLRVLGDHLEAQKALAGAAEIQGKDLHHGQGYAASLKFQEIRVYLEEFGAAGISDLLILELTDQLRRHPSMLVKYLADESKVTGRINRLGETRFAARQANRRTTIAFRFDFEGPVEGWSGGAQQPGASFDGGGYRAQGEATLEKRFTEDESVLSFAARLEGGGTLRVAVSGEDGTELSRTFHGMPAGAWRVFVLPIGSLHAFGRPRVHGKTFVSIRFTAEAAGGAPAVLLLDNVILANQYNFEPEKRPQ